MPKLKIDLHIHTNYSDSMSSLNEVLRVAKEKHLDGIAITDHENVTESTHASEMAPDLLIIPGVEIESEDGHILVLGVRNPPPRRLRAVEIAEYARKNRGVIIIPHPNIPLISMKEKIIRQIRPDAIETYNAKVPFFRHFVKKNTELADRLGIPKTGGSDAHSHQSVGDAYTIIDADARSVEAVLNAIQRGKIESEGGASSFREILKTNIYLILRKIHLIKSSG